MVRSAFLVLVVSVSVACGGGGPTTPGTPVLNVTGIWDFTSTLTGGAPGLAECSGLHTLGEKSTAVVSVQHTGNAITATSTSSAGGLVCSYAGTLNDSQFLVTLNSCNVAFTRAACAVNLYDVRLVSQSLSGSASATSINGTGAATENLYFLPIPPFPQQFQNLAGSGTLLTTFTMTKR